ncbi:MAG: hypothetical protein SFU99_00120 [Saprospiraceae bacterium]|nr:hypothetical protein [Saprospiraceae bacterium]
MKNSHQKISILKWGVSILGILFAAFLSVFALDVFSEGYDFKDTVVALFMHLIPTFLIVLLLIIAWRRVWIGGIGFLILGSYYLYNSWGEIEWAGILLLSVPLFILAILFFFIGWYQKKISARL